MTKSLIKLLVFFLVTSNLSAQVKVDNLQDLWKIAVLNNPTQKVYALKSEQIMDTYKASQAFYYPQASLGFNGQDNLILGVTPIPGVLLNQPGKTFNVQFGKHYTYSPGLTLTKDLFDWQAMLQNKIARENIELNKVQQDAYLQTLKTQMGQYYYGLLVAKASMQISEKDYALADSIYKVIKNKFDEGLTDASAVNQALINENNIKQNIYQSEQLTNQAIANIKILSGLPPSTSFVFSEIKLDNQPNATDLMLGTDKTLIPYKNSITISELQQKAQKALFLPKFSALGYFGFQQFQNNFQMNFNKNAWTDYQYLGLGITWNIFTGFANSNNLKGTIVQKRIAEENYKAAKDQSAITDSLLLDNYTTYNNMVTTSRNTFDLYGKNMDLSLQKFREGLISIDAYFKTFQDYLTAENTYLNNLANLLTTKASIEARQ